MDNDFINDFIEEYKNQPCLWQASSADFKDRKKRQEAYYKLIDVASKHGEHYNIERTKQKINNLRCAFRHQLKKFTESKNNKNGKDEAYCPKRRYIESLMFLLNEEQLENAKVDNLKTTPVTTKKNANEISKNCNDSLNSKKVSTKDKSKVYCEAIVIPGDKTAINTTTTSVTSSINEDVPISKREQRKQRKENIVKSIEEIPAPELTTKETHDSSVHHIEVHCDDNVDLLWSSRSNTLTSSQKSNETCIQPITTSTPVTISSVPVVTVPAVSTIQVPVSVPITNSLSTTSRVIETTSSSNNNNNNNNNNKSNIISNVRTRTMSFSSQNSLHVNENASKKVKIDCSATNFEKLLSLACSKINNLCDSDDEFSIFGRMVSCKLRSMDSQQAIIAEKLITDILLEGQMKMLAYPLRTTATTIPFRQDESALIINLNENTAGIKDQQTTDSKYSSNIQYSTGNES